MRPDRPSHPPGLESRDDDQGAPRGRFRWRYAFTASWAHDPPTRGDLADMRRTYRVSALPGLVVSLAGLVGAGLGWAWPRPVLVLTVATSIVAGAFGYVLSYRFMEWDWRRRQV